MKRKTFLTLFAVICAASVIAQTPNWDTYKPNPGLPPDSVELAPAQKPVHSHFYHKPPDRKPSKVPGDFVLVKVYQGGKFIGWQYMQEKEVARLHSR
jgi:hypothetical protein